MASRSLGSLTLDMVVKTGAFIAGMTAAERQANKSLSAIEKRAYKFGETLGKGLKIGALAATAALGALALAVGKAIDNADEIRDLSIRLGTSTETLSAFGYAASQTGTDLDSLGRGMKILAKNAADAIKPTSEQAKIFDALGISVTDVTGKLKDQSALIPEIADAFKGMEDGTTKTALALALFGKSGTEMIEFLNQGADGLQDFEDKARSLGIIIDSETAAAADEFNDILGDLKAIVSGGALTIAKELLPALKEGATDLKNLAQQGELASNAATVLGAALKLGVGTLEAYNAAVRYTAIGFEALIPLIQGAAEAAQNIGPGGLFKEGSVLGGVAKAKKGYEDAQASMIAYWEEQDRRIAKANSPFRDVTITSDSTYGGSNIDRGKLNNALAGIGGGSKKSSRGGKSDAEKEADKLKAAYDRINESMTEQIGLFGVTGEAAKLRYELEHGELSKLTEAEKEGLISKAERIDLLNQEKDAEESLVKARAEQDRDFNNVNDAIKEQIELIGMTRDEMEIYNNLVNAGVTAESARGQEIIKNTQLLQEMSEAMADQVEAMDAIRDGSKDFLKDLITGSKSFKDSFLDALDSIEDKLLDMVLQNFSGQLFGKQGDPAGGSTGGFWASLLGSFFGGGKASGGSVMPGKFYRVNETGTEMFSQGGKDYLMTGSQSGVVTPNHKLGGQSLNVTQVFNNPVMADRRSDAQRQLQAGRELRVATRNS